MSEMPSILSNDVQALVKGLHESRQYYLICLDASGHYTYVNQHFINQFGFIARDFNGLHFTNSVHPDDQVLCENTVELCLQQPGIPFPCRVRKPDGVGNYYWTDWDYILVPEKLGESPFHIWCIGYDATAREKLLESIVDTQHDMIVRLTPDLLIEFANRAFMNYFKLDTESLSNVHFLTLFPSNNADELYEHLNHLMSNAVPTKSLQTEIRYEDDGSTIWHTWTFQLIRNTRGEVAAIQASGMDISLTREALLMVEKQNERLREVARLQAHDIRMPLTNIIGIANLIQSESKNAEIRNLATLLTEATAKLDHIIHTIINRAENV